MSTATTNHDNGASAVSGDGSCNNKPIPLRSSKINNQQVVMTNIFVNKATID